MTVLKYLPTVDEALAAKTTVLPTQITQRGNAEAVLVSAPLRLTNRIEIGEQEHWYPANQATMPIFGEDDDMALTSKKHGFRTHPVGFDAERRILGDRSRLAATA
jgi:xanthine dehydrogenase molybdopterin-binding subunit B